MKQPYLLNGLDCDHCAAKIEQGVADIDGVTNASVSFLTTKLTFEAQDDKIDEIVKKAKKVIKKVEPDVEIKEL